MLKKTKGIQKNIEKFLVVYNKIKIIIAYNM